MLKTLKYFIIILPLVMLLPKNLYSQVVGETACKANNSSLVYRQPSTGAINALLGILLGPGYGPGSGAAVNQYGPCVNYQQYHYKPRTGLGTACRICETGFIISGLSLLCNNQVSIGIAGTLVDLEIISCPLDDYSWALCASVSALGFIYIRNRRKV